MKKNITKNGFTLVELIVVITILAILGTIAFISLQGYSRDARDSTRLSNIKLIETSILIYYQDTNKFPNPSLSTEIVYKGSVAWYQGIFGDSTKMSLGNNKSINTVPTDPLTQSKFSYSITKNKQEYQIGTILEGGEELSFNKLNQTFAESKELGVARIIGNYNGVFLKVQTGSIDYILSVPSIIASDINNSNLLDIINNNKLTYNGGKNLPASYLNAGYDISKGESELLVNNSIEVFSGSLNELKNNQPGKGILIKKIQDAYSGTLLINSYAVGTILDVPAGNTNINLSTLNNLNAALEQTFHLDYEYIGDIPNNLNTISTDLRNIFNINSAYTKGWVNNSCDPSQIDIVEYKEGDNIPLVMADNTIYKIYEGMYPLNTSLIMGNCTAIIGMGEVTFYNPSATTAVSAIILNGVQNAVINNFKIDGNLGAGITTGVSLIDSSNSTLNNIDLNKTSSNGFSLLRSNNNIFNNSTSGNSTYAGLYLDNSSNNSLSYSNMYDNKYSVQIINSSNNNKINNIRAISGTSFGLYMKNSDNNIINNLLLYGNADCGIRIENADFFTFNNFQTFNNSCLGNSYIIGSNTFLLNNGYSYKSSARGLYFVSGNTNGILNNVNIYGNNGTELAGTDGISYFGNLNIELGGGTLAINQGNISNSLISALNLKNGILNTSFTYTSDYLTDPNVVNWNSINTGSQGTAIFTGNENYTFGALVGSQSQPAFYNSSTGKFEYYGTNGIEYNSSKKIGEW